ncbi:hypothetical protein NYO98_10355 [Nocardioides sp. STR2]|uniref:Uncharacterized protein n=1 Tax=Nocardioides pini TaxID=2975053 RepID=A0ABT4CCJ5_9ACTN|nr:hypothetical protein [Nocardioides pini]MCY4726679.1 hypothetical protein [Nocardioides pini]
MASKMRPPFVRLHAATLDPATRPDELAARLRDAEAVTGRHRLAEGAVYASGCRRYLLDTGDAWTRAGDAAPSWGGESDHRSRIAGDAWRCSCGDSGTAADPVAAHAAHAASSRAVAV